MRRTKVEKLKSECLLYGNPTDMSLNNLKQCLSVYLSSKEIIRLKQMNRLSKFSSLNCYSYSDHLFSIFISNISLFIPLSLTKHYLRAPSFTPAHQPASSLYFSVNQKNMQRWQLASVTRPIQTTTTLTQLITHTEEPTHQQP